MWILKQLDFPGREEQSEIRNMVLVEIGHWWETIKLLGMDRDKHDYEVVSYL